MKTLSLLLVVILLPPHSFASGGTLFFTAQIQDDELAEEAIRLLRCVSQNSGLPWELAPAISGSNWMQIRQEAHGLTGRYHSSPKETTFTLAKGEWKKTCQQLEPKAADALPTRDSPIPEEIPNFPTEKKSPRWLWLIGAATIAIGGFLYWKSRQPDFSQIEMR